MNGVNVFGWLDVEPKNSSDSFHDSMNQVGMDVTYTKGSLRQPLREQPSKKDGVVSPNLIIRNLPNSSLALRWGPDPVAL